MDHSPFNRSDRAETAPRRGRAARASIVVVILMLGIGVACSKQETATSSGGTETPDFQLESYNEIGPNAFTAPVDTPPPSNAPQASSAPVCDKKEFVKDLQSRPDAIREWAKVLKIPESQVPAYVDTLQTATLSADFKVTNHGLKDGQAYPRNSTLSAGTAVLVDPNFGARTNLAEETPPQYQNPPTGGSSTTTAKSSTTATASYGYPVTRCKCGNPLLPPLRTGGPPKSGGTSAPNTTPRGTTPGTNPGTTGRPTTPTTSRGGGGGSSTTRPNTPTSNTTAPASSSSTPSITRVTPSVTTAPEKSP